MNRDVTLSVIVPVFNERVTVRRLLERVMRVPIRKEVLIVDDGSTDGTTEVIREIVGALPDDPMNRVRAFFHSQNAGKGAAIRTGIAQVTGDIVLIQDADLEYDPDEYPKLIEPILNGDADVVYGSRFLSGPRRVLFFRHTVGNQLLTFLSNLCTDLNLTDMETCYKVFRTDVVRRLHPTRDRFGIEPEITAKLARLRLPHLRGAHQLSRPRATGRARRSAGATGSPRSGRSSSMRWSTTRSTPMRATRRCSGCATRGGTTNGYGVGSPRTSATACWRSAAASATSPSF